MSITLPNWTHPDTGEVYTDIHIRVVIDNFCAEGCIDIQYKFFPSSAHESAGYSPIKIFSDQVLSVNAVWGTYFAQSALNPEGKNPHNNAENYILTLDGTQQGGTSGIDFTTGVIEQQEI